MLTQSCPGGAQGLWGKNLPPLVLFFYFAWKGLAGSRAAHP